MGLGTAGNRLGRFSHFLGRLVRRAFSVVTTPPNKALQLTANPLRGSSAAELGR